MHKIIRHYNLNAGDSVVVPKSNFRIIDHYAVFLGCDDYGIEWFAENHSVQGVRIISANDFFSNVIQVNRIKRFKGNNEQRRLAVQKALQKAGKPYSLINYNCEHFSNEIQNGKATSHQVVWTAVAAAIALFFIFRK